MYKPRFVVFDDSLQAQRLGVSADRFADLLRYPLAAICVRVVRQHRLGSPSALEGFQGRGLKRSRYKAMLNAVDRLIAGVAANLSTHNFPEHADRASNTNHKGRVGLDFTLSGDEPDSEKLCVGPHDSGQRYDLKSEDHIVTSNRAQPPTET
jgi:hypothetical protein